LRYANLRQKRAIYGIINDGVDIRSGRTETITTQDGVIVIYSGRMLREFLFGQYREEVEACVVEAIRSIKSVLDVLFSKNEL